MIKAFGDLDGDGSNPSKDKEYDPVSTGSAYPDFISQFAVSQDPSSITSSDMNHTGLKELGTGGAWQSGTYDGTTTYPPTGGALGVFSPCINTLNSWWPGNLPNFDHVSTSDFVQSSPCEHFIPPPS